MIELFNNDNASIDRLVTALAQSERLIGESCRFRVRTVAANLRDHGWQNFGTMLTVEPYRASEPIEKNIGLGRVYLIEKAAAMPERLTWDFIRQLLTTWRSQLETSSGYQFQQTFHATHHQGHNRLSKWPCWVAELVEVFPDRNVSGGVPGPFLDVENDIFAESIGALAADWLSDASYSQAHSVRHLYTIVLPDRRAVITRVKFEEEHLTVSVDAATGMSIFCAGTVVDLHGVRHRDVAPVTDGVAELDLPRNFSSLDVWSIEEGGVWLDQFHDSEGKTPWGGSIFVAEPGDAAVKELEEALLAGEGERIEFKEWIPVGSGSEKPLELLKTCVGFANAGGGTLFIGVNDEAVPTGTAKQLSRMYAKEHGNDLDQQRKQYVSDLRKFLIESVAPRFPINFEWVTLGQHTILQVQCGEGQQKPHFANDELGNAYLRVGATTRRIRHADLPRFFDLPYRRSQP